MTRYLSSL